MTVTSSPGALLGGTTVTARNVGDWKGAALAAQSTANRAHFLIGTCDANLHP
jgi:hypothetical protein